MISSLIAALFWAALFVVITELLVYVYKKLITPVSSDEDPESVDNITDGEEQDKWY